MKIEKIVALQRRFFRTGTTKNYGFRYTALLKLQVALDKYEPELKKALKKDLHKSGFESYMTEIGMTKAELVYTMKHLRRWMRPKMVRTPLAQFPSNSYQIMDPYGVVLVMAPWNYPVLLCLEPLISAIAAGNCVVLKPSAYAPSVSHVLARMLEEIYPSRFVKVVEGGREENTQLLEQNFDKIFFTGSSSVGKIVLKKAAEHLTPVTLELGGKSPCIVDDTANLKLAARRIAFGKLLNSGQTCVAPDYILVQENVKEELIYYLEKEIRKMLGENPFQNPDYPRMVNGKHYKRVLDLMQCENIRCGGYGDSSKLQIMPSIVDEVTLKSPIMNEEIFGPVLPIMTYGAREEILPIVEHFRTPLACYLFTNDRSMKRFILKNISFGGGCINDTVIHLATSYMGFGGVGTSGMGTYHGKEGFECFTHKKSVVDKKCWLDLPMRYHPYDDVKNMMIHRFM